MPRVAAATRGLPRQDQLHSAEVAKPGLRRQPRELVGLSPREFESPPRRSFFLLFDTRRGETNLCWQFANIRLVLPSETNQILMFVSSVSD